MRIDLKFICLSIVFTFLVIMASNVTVADASEVGTLTKVASNVGYFSNPVWSPDGNEILFSRDEGLYKISSDGSGEKQLTFNSTSDYAWSPDGSKISYGQYYNTYDEYWSYDVCIMYADGTEKTQLLGPVGDMQFISYTWFPSGSKIAYATGWDNIGTLWVINSDGSDNHEVGGWANSELAVSPDESKIACFCWDWSYQHEICIRNLNQIDDYYAFFAGGIAQQTQSWHPQIWSPDSSKIVYWSYENGNGDIYTIKVDGTEKTQLTAEASNENSPIFSPDGSKILFVSDMAGNNDVWVMDTDGNNKVQLTTDPAEDSCPAWSPDGKKIAFYSEREGDHGIYTLTLKKGSDSVTNLQSTSGSNWINWTWTNPSDPDFNHTEIYLNNIFQTNTSLEYFNATGLEPETSYTIGTHTVDIYGNMNETWVNATATTLKAPVPVFPGYTNPPIDLDQDGLYEDINGNGMLDFDDVVAYYDNMEWIEENMPIEFFDYNKNDLIDFDDVVKLYDLL